MLVRLTLYLFLDWSYEELILGTGVKDYGKEKDLRKYLQDPQKRVLICNRA